MKSGHLPPANVLPAHLRLVLLLGAALLLSDSLVRAQERSDAVSEYGIKAAYLYNLAQFVDWPQAAPVSEDPAFRIGIVGEDPFGDALKPLLEKKLKDRGIDFVHFPTTAEVHGVRAEGLHLLFLAPSEADDIDWLLARLSNDPVLTVSDIEGFARRGGMVELVYVNDRIRFSVNRTAVAAAGLAMSSQVYRLALEVINP